MFGRTKVIDWGINMGLVLASVYSPSVNELLPQQDLPSIPLNMLT